MKLKIPHDPNAIIDALGGPTAVARICHNAMTSQAVSQWRDNGIPSGWLSFLQATHPELFQQAAA